MERLSQLMDGELDPDSARRILRQLKQQDDFRDNWDTFHLIGDTLRGEGMLSAEFGRRFVQRFSDEPTMLAPKQAVSRAPKLKTYALSAAASLAAVALVGWFAVGSPTATMSPAGLAGAPVPPIAQSAPDAAIVPTAQLTSKPYDGTLNEYLMAHTGFSPSTAIQGVAPYIRTVVFSRPEQDR